MIRIQHIVVGVLALWVMTSPRTSWAQGFFELAPGFVEPQGTLHDNMVVSGGKGLGVNAGWRFRFRLNQDFALSLSPELSLAYQTLSLDDHVYDVSAKRYRLAGGGRAGLHAGHLTLFAHADAGTERSNFVFEGLTELCEPARLSGGLWQYGAGVAIEVGHFYFGASITQATAFHGGQRPACPVLGDGVVIDVLDGNHVDETFAVVLGGTL